jgi:phosphate starvation-inducible protein PhoH
LYPEGYSGYVALRDVTSRLKDIKGIGFFEFAKSDVVRHPLVAEVLQRL